MGRVGFGLMAAILLTMPVVAGAQTMVPSQNGSCPSGATNAGSGYCRSTSGRGFIPSDRGGCPSGTTSAGAGYCATDGSATYVPAIHGGCPSGTTSAGAGYCRGR
jgi:hypothetical protein